VRTSGTAVALGSWPDNTEPWYAARRSRIGGSDIAQILGLSPWGDRYSLWCEKSQGIAPAITVTPLMWAGHYVELAAAKWYADNRLPDDLHLRNSGTWTHRDRDWQLANPDRLITSNARSDKDPVGVLEIKFVPNSSHKFGDDGTDQIPVHYWTQVQWYMATFGVAWCDLVALGTWGFRCYRIDADPDWQAMAVQEGQRFMDAVALGIEPDWQPTPWAYEADRNRHPEITKDQVTVDDIGLLSRLVEVSALKEKEKAAKDALKDPEAEAKAALAHLMGTAGTAVDQTGAVLATRRARKTKAGDPGRPYVVIN
jgi:putative phage-type endonuclease